MPVLQIKRAYDDTEPADGYRILVDRLWPRGLSKEALHLDEWVKDIAPSNETRKAFGHDPARMDEFRARYLAELEHNPEAPAFREQVAQKLRHGNVTLVYAAHDAQNNQAVVLRDWLLKQMKANAAETTRVAPAGG